MTKPVNATHYLKVLSNSASLALRDTTVGTLYEAELCPHGGEMHDGAGRTASAFIAVVDDVGETCILRHGGRSDIVLLPINPTVTCATPAPSVTVHVASGVYRDCTPGKTYPAKRYNDGDTDAEGLSNNGTTLGFFDDAGDFVNQGYGGDAATFNW